MSLFSRFVFGLCFSALCSALAAAQIYDESLRLPNIQRFTPFLSVNESPEICLPYETAWRGLYNSEKGLSESWLNLKDTFPNANFIYPSDNNKTVPIYSPSSFPFDYDGDGENEVLYFENAELGWRHLGTGLYFYESQAIFEAEGEKLSKASRGKRFSPISNNVDTQSKKLAFYPKLRGPNVFQIDGRLYSQSDINSENGILKSSIDWVRPGHEPTPICEVQLSPSRPSLATLSPIDTGISTVSAALNSVYGGPETGQCYGTMGWRPPRPDSYWSIINHRPKAMRLGIRGDVLIGTEIEESQIEDTAREFRYIAWGFNDPTSFEVVNALKTAYPKFVAEYSLYYQIYFDMDKTTAQQTAKRAYRFLLDSVYYARQTGPHYNIQLSSDLKVGPETSLEDIAKGVVEKALAAEPPADESAKHLKISQNERARQYYSALRLGLMIGGETEQLKILFDRLIAAPDNTLRVLDSIQSDHRIDPRQKLVNGLFLDGLKQPEMMKYFLEFGAEADVSTNYFGKTALMYAAQNNDLDAVNLLLSNGANPNTSTKYDDTYCKRPITQDARTPLMYAMENAEPTLIYTLLEAGADVTSKDTQHNSVTWYLNKNTGLSNWQKDQIRQRLK